MIRELISKLNRSWSDRSIAPRRRHAAVMKVWFDPDSNTELARQSARAACIFGETLDISRTGVGFLVPAIRLKEKYLVGQERSLNIEIDLPTGKIQMKAIGCRYEKVGVHISTERFLVGAHITSLEGADRENYEAFLKRRNLGARSATASLELGID